MVVPWIDIAKHAYNAGFRDQSLRVAIALTAPESGRDSEAVHLNDNGTIDRGLWQINSVHLEPLGLLFGWTAEDLFDPAKNAQAAFNIWFSASFRAWSAYKAGLHTDSMDAAAVAMDARARLAIKEDGIKSLVSYGEALEKRVAELEEGIKSIRSTTEGLI